MPNRFDAIPAAYWPRLGPADNGLSVDLATLEAKVANLSTSGPSGGGGGSNVNASGPYTLDPKRTPAGQVTMLPAGTPVVTHIGTRFQGPAGTAPNDQTQNLTGTLRFNGPNPGSWQYVNGGLFGTSLQVTTTGTAGDIVQVSASLPAGEKDILVSAVMTIPEPSADCRVLQLNRTGAGELGALLKPGSAAGTVNVIFDDSKTAGSWNWTSPDVPSGKRIRIAFAAKIGGGSDGAQKAAAFLVGDDGTETQIGTTYEVTAAPTPASDVYTTIAWGKLTNNSGLASKNLRLESVRVAYGSGAYALGLLRDERLYPAAV